jgi:hypothetical protein
MAHAPLAVNLRRRSDAMMLLHMRRRAARKMMRASRIATLRLAGLAHEDCRARMELTVQEYKRARRWLRDAVTESLMSGGLLTVDEALRGYADRYVESVIRVGLLKDQGRAEAYIRQQLDLTEELYGAALEWYRDAQSGGERIAE